MEIGVDIVEISRIRAAYERYGAAFLRRILTGAEAEQCLGKPDPVESLAGRFAAKEAISKALGTGLSKGLTWHAIEVLNDGSGKPVARFVTGAPAELMQLDVRISISHDRHSAVAMALVGRSL